MFDFLDTISYPVLGAVALFALLAPFQPMPHVVEKLIMLKEGTLKKPLDIFDLFFHCIPTIGLGIKLWRDYIN
jgi:hypothetical protein